MIDEAARHDLNRAARALLGSVLARGDRAPGSSRVATMAVIASFDTDPEASAQALRPMLSDQEIREHGFHQLPVLAEAVPQLLTHDPKLVLDVYRAAFSWRDDSEESTPLRTGVLALSSNRRQDYDGARRRLADVFGEVVVGDPAAAVAALKTAITAYLQRRELQVGEARPLRLGGRQLEVQADHSAMWDADRRVVDPEPQMLQAWQQTLVGEVESAEAISAALTGLVAESPLPAALISRLLLAGSQAPERFGATLADDLDQAEVLSASDTLVAYGELLRALWTRLDGEQRGMVERALLDLPDTMSPDRPEIGERRRDRLVALLDPESLMTDDARELAALLRAARAPTDNAPLVRIEAGWGPADGEDLLRSQGIDPDRTHNRRALELAHVLRDWHQARHQADTPDCPLAELIEGLRTLLLELPMLRASSELAPELLEQVEGYLAQGGLELAEQLTAETPRDQLELVLEIASIAAEHRLPEAASEDPGVWDGDMSHWAWPAPRVDAASIWLALAREPVLANAEVLDGISRLASDPSAAVRVRIAEHAWWLMHADTGRVWTIAEQLAASEERATVSHALLVTLSHLYSDDPNRAIVAIDHVLRRERAGRASGHLLKAGAGLLAELWIFDDRIEGPALLDEVVSQIAARMEEAGEITGRLRRALAVGEDDTAGADAVRSRAFALYNELVEAACDLFDELVAQEQPDPQVLAPTARLLDTLGAELYFSSGAYERDHRDGQEASPDPQRFYDEASDILDLATRIGVPHGADYVLQTLSHLVDIDPRGVIRRIDELLQSGERWGLTADSLTEGHVMPTVSHLLAAHRDLLLVDADTRGHLVSALSAFSRAGFPSARRILYGLDDMFR